MRTPESKRQDPGQARMTKDKKVILVSEACDPLDLKQSASRIYKNDSGQARVTGKYNDCMYVYIMANNRPTLYTGVTNNLIRRVYEHKEELVDGFTKIYHLHKLVYYEVVDGQMEAIFREKQIKDMDRVNKLDMIRKFNPTFKDLYSEII